MLFNSSAIIFVSKKNGMDIRPNILLSVNNKVYLKNPESSNLGKQIISGSVDLIHDIGFESFTFKKLSVKINSTEASIYRYFESKHKLLLYLSLWYYEWLSYKLLFSLTNIDDPKERLSRSINLLTEKVVEDSDFSHIDEPKLNQIVVYESTKTYLNKQVDEDNSLGLFKPYKDLVEIVSEIILEINPSYKYPHMLVSTVIEGAKHQRFFAKHLPRLTDVIEGEDAIVTFYRNLVFNSIH